MTNTHYNDNWDKGLIFSARKPATLGKSWFYEYSEGVRIGPFRSKWSAIRARWFATCDGCTVFYVTPEEAALCQRYEDDIEAGIVEAQRGNEYAGFPSTTEPGFYYGHNLNDAGCSTFIGTLATTISVEVAAPGNRVAFGPFPTAEAARQAAADGALSLY